MPENLPPSFSSVLLTLRPAFSAPSFDNFRVLVAGWIHALGHHRLSDVLRAASAIAAKHFSAYYRFFSRARWSLDELGLALLALVIALTGAQLLELIADDTLSRRYGKKVALTAMHADPLLRYKGKPVPRYGHVFVVLSVHVALARFGLTGWALPFLFRLFQGKKRGGQKDGPSEKGRRLNRRRHGARERQRPRLTDQCLRRGKLIPCAPRPETDAVAQAQRPTKVELSAELVLLVAHRFPEVQWRVIGDHLYCSRALIQRVRREVSNVEFVVRGHDDAALYEPPPPRVDGRAGRPRLKGERLPNPKQWAQRHPKAFRAVTLTLYGKQVPLKLASYTGIAHRTLRGQAVRYVISRDPRGIYRPLYLMTTDLSLSEEQVVEAFARRWPLEQTFRDTKQKLGLQDAQTQLPASVRRTAPFALLVYSFVVVWFVFGGDQEAARLRAYRSAWDLAHPRPSFSDMLAALRRLGWAQGILDPQQPDTTRTKLLQEYLVKVAALA